jgi:3-dehydroquinate dehydratase-2
MVVNGPNLNLLGRREPEKYGREALSDIQAELSRLASELDMSLAFYQSNHEGDLVDAVQKAGEEYDGAILNAGAYTHTSIALRDAVAAVDVPVVEVHWTNPAGRSPFRHVSCLAGVAAGSIAGFGKDSYILALLWFNNQKK